MARDDWIYNTGNKKESRTYDFQKFKTIKSFASEIYNVVITLNNAFEEQTNLKMRLITLTNILNQKTKMKKQEKNTNLWKHR